MTLKHPFLDYEPVKRSPKPEADDIDAYFLKRPAAPNTAKDEMDGTSDSSEGWTRASRQKSVAVRRDEKKTELKLVQEKWIHKHGHSLSYAGIFMFTAFVFFRPYELSPSLMWLSTSAFWIALATLSVYIVTQLGLENSITARPREINLILLLVVTGVLSIPLALEPKKAFDSFFEFLKVVLIFIVMINVVRTEKRLERLWILVLIATFLLSLNAINDYRLDRLVLQGRRIKGSIGGLFDNPNDLALHLVTMFPIALALVFGSRNPIKKALFVIVSVLIIGGIVVTFSRGGFLALMAASGVFLWKLARSSRWMIVLVAPLLVVLFILIVPGGYKTRLSTSGDESSMARFDDLKRSLFIAARHPVFGVGMNNYILYSNANKASHNAYTQVAAEMGAAAAVFYVLFIVAPFTGLRRIEHETHQLKSARRFYYGAISLQASLIGYMVASFFASVAYLWYIYYLVAYAVCLRRMYDFAVERDIATASET